MVDLMGLGVIGRRAGVQLGPVLPGPIREENRINEQAIQCKRVIALILMIGPFVVFFIATPDMRVVIATVASIISLMAGAVLWAETMDRREEDDAQENTCRP